VTEDDRGALGGGWPVSLSIVLMAFCATSDAVTLAGATVADATPMPAAGCESSRGLDFVCGALKPEDLAHIPGTRWLIASGFSNGAGLKLIDTNALKLRTWYTGSAAQIRKGGGFFGGCPAPPDPKSFNVQGISLRISGSGIHTLYATNHGGRESVEIFSVDARAAVPVLTWTGCAILPEGVAANAVASFSDGTILITELTRAGTTIADFVNGQKTGAVYSLAPGANSFTRLVGTELPGNNGLETAPNDSEFYVVAFGWHAVVAFSRSDPSKALRKSIAPGFMPDNIHWDNGRLIAAGMQTDEPACGGLRKIINGSADGMLCHRGYVVAQLEPESMAYRIIAYAEPDPVFNGVSGAVLIGAELWLSSYQADRIAHRTLPWIDPSR
jgi:hypothetical protein